MTEAEWLSCRTSRKLMDFLHGDFLHGRMSERKLRLIGCACARRVWSRVKLNECHVALDVAERIADGIASEAEVSEGFRLANYARDMNTGTAIGIPRRYKTREARCAAWAVYELVEPLDREYRDYLNIVYSCVLRAMEFLKDMPPDPTGHFLHQARVIRDIVGNPFRPVTFDSGWRTSDVMLLAQRVYDTRDFSAMPILADALQDAGCTADDLLSHLRDPKQIHYRGCWAVDLALGKG